MSFAVSIGGPPDPKSDWFTKLVSQNNLSSVQLSALRCVVRVAWLDRGNCRAVAASDGERLFVAGRLRFDRRAELVRKLDLSTAPSSDAELLLSAYDRWGVSFVDHIAGDFSFFLWDQRSETAILTRDQIGVHPLYHGNIGSEFCASDRLTWLATNPALTSTFDDFWIADHLVRGFQSSLERTVYTRIARLPPGHLLRHAEKLSSVRRYWSLSLDRPTLGLTETETTEAFHVLLHRAVMDRMPKNNLGISLSGGLDSSTLAAVATKVTADPQRIVGLTICFDHLIADDERSYSAQVARHLGIRHVIVPGDDLQFDAQWRESSFSFPEPSITAVNVNSNRKLNEQYASLAQTWFYGEGVDNALSFDWKPYLRWLAGEKEWLHYAKAVSGYLHHKSMREWLLTLTNRLNRESASIKSNRNTMPVWLDSEFARRSGIVESLRREQQHASHPWHPLAFRSFTSSAWSNLLGRFEPESSGVDIEWRHPFLDVEVLGFLLALPPIPWCRNKYLIRNAMQNMLPSTIIARPKTPLSADPLARAANSSSLKSKLCQSMSAYVNQRMLNEGMWSQLGLYERLRILTLDHWLAASR